MKIHYDLIVIGAGPAGTPAAMTAAQFGAKVLLVDKRDAPGGECLFEGCIPSKVLENAANNYWRVISSKKFHIQNTNTAQIHWEAVIQDKDEILKKRSQGAMQVIKKLPTLDFKQGTAKFTDAHTLNIDGEFFSFDKALIATGGKTTIPPLKGNGVDKIWTNKDVFFEKELPKELLFIGAGAISCELTQMFNKLGVKCHILERSERILRHLPSEAALTVQNKMIENGVTVDLHVDLQKIDYENDKFIVTFMQEGKERILECKHVLMATGRGANVDGLELENANVEYNKGGVVVNKQLQSSQAHIYACGDCVPGPKFAHTATYEAGIVVHNMFAPSSHFVNYDKNSWVLFSDPQIGIAGINEQQAHERGLDVDIATYDYSQDARSQIDKSTEGFVKFIIDKKSKVIIGIEIVSEDAASLLGEAALIVANEMNSMDIMKAIHPHPTLTESFGKLAQQIFFKSMMQRNR
ncbi:dihydrolipoyl dehydrogenase family protein [Sulfurimonas autotrophica]|uniref:Pyridine nucleotide-disulfide oxidoreductase dimerization region n=1 Tax=Sulfurimonas autotrophica (strain ATCC BAA-671 / DSM 16294 / JCM 11897 / OK10) TaxID=563040 RepID=E0UV01_SULAO|nr:NAD(P)/FAD-dependent oxidoreductase [Sulfurimonas autotrophica]ADN08513.1 pyridine nucleotide-disulfide oxidoreductase dimerization region [Sulfurimonas autotrophica DSM 16294]